MASTPLAIFAYKRPEHLARTLSALEQCARLNECTLHLFCDGPKSDVDASAVAATRVVARAWASRMGAELIERDANLGLARSIVTSVNMLCNTYGRVIVLEDDLIVSPGFVDYMLQALDRYANCPQVYQVSGYMFPVRHTIQTDAFFLPLTTTWGWATWARAWQSFNWEVPGALKSLQNPRLRRRFDLDGSYPYAAMLEQRLAGQNDSWGILWWWAVFCAGGVVLHPHRSLVQNTGFDGSGIHCVTSTRFEVADLAFDTPSTLRFPDKVQVNRRELMTIERFLRTDRQNLLSQGRSYLRRTFGWLVSIRNVQ
jgi:hypothetical protein